MSFPRPMVKVWENGQLRLLKARGHWRGKEAYHAMSGEFGVSLEDAVCGGVVASGVHGVGAGTVQGGREPDIAGLPAGNGNLSHGGGSCKRWFEW